MTIREAIRICLRREHSVDDPDRPGGRHDPDADQNQLDVILRGDTTSLTWVKAGLNYCVPFVVSNLGLLAGKRAEETPASRGS